jgi:hypothetical protein
MMKRLERKKLGARVVTALLSHTSMIKLIILQLYKKACIAYIIQESENT